MYREHARKFHRDLLILLAKVVEELQSSRLVYQPQNINTIS